MIVATTPVNGKTHIMDRFTVKVLFRVGFTRTRASFDAAVLANRISLKPDLSVTSFVFVPNIRYFTTHILNGFSVKMVDGVANTRTVARFNATFLGHSSISNNLFRTSTVPVSTILFNVKTHLVNSLILKMLLGKLLTRGAACFRTAIFSNHGTVGGHPLFAQLVITSTRL
jgi:hypothetical protein